MLEFGMMGLLAARALYLGGPRSKMVYWCSICLCTLYGVLDEFHQYFVPGRSVQASDVAADGLGIFLLAWAYLAYKGERLFRKETEPDKTELTAR